MGGRAVVVALGILIFCVEAGIMYVLNVLGVRQPLSIFLDSLALLAVISPVLYLLYRENERRLNVERRIEEERSRLKSIFDGAGEGICIISPDYRIEMVNARFEEITGIKTPIGLKCYSVLPCKACGTERCIVSRVMTSGSVVSDERELERDGRRIWIGVTAAPMRDAGGRVRGVIAFIRDSTKRKMLEESLRKSKEELERYSKLLEEKNRILEEQYRALKEREERERNYGELLSYLNSIDINHILGMSIRKLVEVTGSLIGLAYVFNEETGQLECIASHSFDDVEFSSDGLPKVVYEKGEWMRVRGDMEVSLGFGKVRVEEVLGIPLVFQGKRMGAIILASAKGYDSKDVEFLKACTSAIASAVNNALSYRLIRDQAKELERMNEELVKANRLKDEFLANVSHELKTPLNSIIGFSNLLLKAKLEERYKRYVEKIIKNANALLKMINDLLDLSKIEAGVMEVNMRTVDIVRIVREVAESFRPQIEGKSLYLKLNLPNHPVITETDPDKVSQILGNLLSNAVKYTEKGCVTVRVEEERDWVKVHVADTGIGIPKDMIDKIFDKFVSLKGGTGLGLAISKKLAELIGGRITVESEVGRGSVFTLWIPMRRVKDRRNVKVLIVDDDPDSLEILSGYVAEMGCEVIKAMSGEECLELAKRERPDLILLDVIMPGMDGWETLKALKSDPDTADIPVVIVSVVTDRDRSIYLGAVDHITKPVSKEALLKTISRYVRGKCGRVLVVDDDEEFLKLMDEYLKDFCREIRFARNGVEALEVLRDFRPDVVVLDLIMPIMDGFKLLEIMRSRRDLVDVPVIIVTGKDLSEEERERLKRMSSSIVRKSSDLRDIIRRELSKIC